LTDSSPFSTRKWVIFPVWKGKLFNYFFLGTLIVFEIMISRGTLKRYLSAIKAKKKTIWNTPVSWLKNICSSVWKKKLVGLSYSRTVSSKEAEIILLTSPLICLQWRLIKNEGYFLIDNVVAALWLLQQIGNNTWLNVVWSVNSARLPLFNFDLLPIFFSFGSFWEIVLMNNLVKGTSSIKIYRSEMNRFHLLYNLSVKKYYYRVLFKIKGDAESISMKCWRK